MRLNTSTTTNFHRKPLRTAEGAIAERISDEHALMRAVASCMLWEPQAYEGGEDVARRIVNLTLLVDPSFAYQVAITARTDWKLRHVPLLIARALAAGSPAQKAVVESLLYQIIQRPDEITEFMAIYWKNGRSPIASCVKRGLAKAFTKFNEYQLAKYDRDSAIKLKDVAFMVHALPKLGETGYAASMPINKPKYKRGFVSRHTGTGLFKLINGTLPTPDTWETELSAGKDKKETFERLLREEKLGALALLRNLRNMMEAKVDRTLIEKALHTVKLDRVLPFRFLSAAKHAPQLEAAIESAMFRCLSEFQKLPGKTALIIDRSGSMDNPISAKSDLSRFDAAAGLAILCREVCESVNIYAFSNEAGRIPARHGMALRDALAQFPKGGSYGWKAVQMANADGYDRIIVITDGQWHTGNVVKHLYYGQAHEEASPEQYSPLIQRDVTGTVVPGSNRAYMVNVAGARNSVGSGRWEKVEGWSESILDYIMVCESME